MSSLIHWLYRLSVLALTAAAVSAPWAQDAAPFPLGDKTLVAWVALDGLDQRGGSALTLDDRRGGFDAVVFGEIEPGRWMAGSEFFRGTMKDQSGVPAETAAGETVQIAIAYRGNEITVWRNGELYSRHEAEASKRFDSDIVAVFGLRHIGAGGDPWLAGRIEDARVYGFALNGEQIRSLKPNDPAGPDPIAWWDFENGSAADRMGLFDESLLAGGARVDEGRLILEGEGDCMIAAMDGDLLDHAALPSGGNPDVSTVRGFREGLINDPHRPVYHFVAPEGYSMPFDPNGAIHWNGRYHLGYIFQNERGHCWGHASSADLIHWRFHPPMLQPMPGDPDRGIFSGNAFVAKDNRVALLYHGVDAGNCIALNVDDDLIEWTKLPSNPIVPIPREGDPGYGVYSSWDPHGWPEGDAYYAIFGGAKPTLFKSANLTDWEYRGPFLSNDLPGVDDDEDISCPDFFPLGGKHMLLCISHKRGCRYYLGEWRDETFYPETHARMNWAGGTCFAPESLLDARGRRIMWAWVLDRRPRSMIDAAGWSGTMTLPRVLSLADDGTLRIEPVEELETLRTNSRRLEPFDVAPGSGEVLKSVAGDCLELEFEIDPGGASAVILKVLRSPDGAEETAIVYEPERKTLTMDVSKSSLNKDISHKTFCMYGGENPDVTRQEAPLELREGEALKLRVFIDRSIVEVFANGRQCVTQRVYPERHDSRGVALSAKGGPYTVRSANAWDMAPANPW